MPKLRWLVNRGFLKIFLALLLIVTVMFISNYLVYRNSVEGIYEQVGEKNRLVVQNMIRVFDDTFKNVYDIIYAIQNMPYRTLLQTTDGRGSESMDMHEVYLMNDDLRQIVRAYDYIEEVVVFRRDSDLAITTAGTIRLSDLFRMKLGNRQYNEEFWRSLAQTSHPARILPAQWYSQWNHETGAVNGSSRKLLAIAASNLSSPYNILVFLNVDKLMLHVNHAAMMKGTALVMLDAEQNVILNTEETSLFELMQELKAGSADKTTLQTRDYEYNIYRSEYNEFTYVHKQPYAFADMNLTRDANLQIIAIAIGFAVVLSAILSLYLYKPMRVIFKAMGGRDPRQIDFRAILSAIVRLKEENERYQARLDEADRELRRVALLDAVGDRAPSRETRQRMQTYVADRFKEPYFLMALLDVRRTGDADSSDEPSTDRIETILGDGLRERFPDAYALHAGGDRYVAMIGVSRAGDRERAVRLLTPFVKQAKRELGPGCDLIGAVGRLYPAGVQHCAQAYREAADGLRNRPAGSQDELTDASAIRYGRSVSVRLDAIEKMSHYLAGGNERECLRLMDEWFAWNTERRVPHHQLVAVAKTAFYELLKHADFKTNESDAGKAAQALEAEFVKRVESALHAGEVRDALAEAARTIARGGKRETKSKLNAASIAQYIERNYMHCLHLDHMAEQLETSPKYFSNYFKKSFGMNFIEYLNKVRLAHAKEMLTTTDLTVAEIGERAGYLNSSTFASTFKKYAGVSPSEYRKHFSGGKAPTGGENR